MRYFDGEFWKHLMVFLSLLATSILVILYAQGFLG